MARFNFTSDDVARTRFSPAAAPVLETMLVMAELRGLAAAPGRRADRWLREAQAAFPRRPPTWVRNLADGDRESVELVVRALHDLHRALIEPHWDSALLGFHAEVARRMPALAADGHEGLFSSLHPRLRWRENGLDRAGFDGEWDLHGLGLVLMPSAFWTGDPLFSLSDDGVRPHALIYAARPRGVNGRRPADGTTPRPRGDDSLAALLGPTRAAVLRALTAPRGTAELAGIVGISPASASEHAKVLRAANLIETSREGRAARHSVTPLGQTMLGQLTAATAWPR